MSKIISNTEATTRTSYQTFEYTPVPIVISMGKDLSIDFANKLALPILKQSFEQVKGKKISSVLREVFSDQAIESIHQYCFVKREAFTISQKQLINVSEDKPVLSWFEIVSTPYFDGDAVVIGVVTYFKDVSAAVDSNRSHELREELVAKFFKQAPIGLVCYRGPEFIVDLANDKALEMWGKTAEEVKGKPVYEIFPEVLTDPLIRQRHLESQDRLKKGETHVVTEVQLTFKKNGQVGSGWYTYIHEPYTNGLGEVVGMMAIAIEVTDQVLARKRLQLITNAIPSLVAYVNTNHEYEFVNSTYEKWFGKPLAEYLGKSIPAVIGPEAYSKVKYHVDKVLTGQSESFESWIQYASGNRRFVSANYVPHIDNDQVVGYISLVNDLTERKKQEEALFENEAKLRLLIEGVGAGTFEYDLKQGSVEWSSKLRSILGVPEDLVIDAQIAWSVVYPEDVPLIEKHTNDLKEGDNEHFMAYDYRIVKRDTGEIRWLHSRAKFLMNEEDGKKVPTRLVGFSLDITEQKAVEERLKKFNQTLENKVKERTSDLSNLNELLLQRNEELNKTHTVLQQLIDSSPELIIVINRDLEFLEVNKPFEDFVQKSRTELIGKEIFEAYGKARGTSQVQLLERALEGETIHIKMNPSISKPNVWFDTYYVPLVINGTVQGVIVLSRDISDIIKSERELASANRQLQDAQHLAKLGSWEWDLGTGTVLWSDEMYQIYGYKEKFQVDFVRATERMTQADAENSSRRTQRHIQLAVDEFNVSGKTLYTIEPLEFSIQLPTGEIKLLRSTGKIELTPEGKMHRLLGTLQDVTEIRSAEAKLGQLVNELEAKNKELESFNYVASHDLKEPLRKIQTFIDRINGNGGIDSNNYLQKIDHAAKRMNHLIESILSLSRISNATLDFNEVDLNKVLEGCKSDLEVRIKETKATITSGRLPVIRGHETQIQQVFSNLIGNSLKFCKTKPDIHIECQIDSPSAKSDYKGKAVNYWRLTFKDNGIGFDVRFKEQVFEPFQRLHNMADYDGTGIGLSIVKKIVERHSGFFDVKSEVGKGAEFIIWLPA